MTFRGSGHFIEYLLGRPDVKAAWEAFMYHPFVMALGSGTLPLESFKGYIIQDYLYLVRRCPPKGRERFRRGLRAG